MKSESFKKLDSILNNFKYMARFKFPFGVTFLDDLFRGVSQTDLILIGAESGKGKTELSTIIAEKSAEAGRRVAYLALEGEPGEIEARILYRKAVQFYFLSDGYDKDVKPDFDEFLDGAYSPTFEAYVTAAKDEFEFASKNLNIVYGGDCFTFQALQERMMALKDETDVFFLDHLHFMDFGGNNELRVQKQIMLWLKTFANNYRKSVFALVQLRKKSLGDKRLMPSIEDVMGSSDIYKISTKAIILHPRGVATSDNSKLICFLQAGKYRRGGDKTYYFGIVKFDFKSNTYDPDYLLCKPKWEKGEETYEVVDFTNTPRWAKNSTRPNIDAVSGKIIE